MFFTKITDANQFASQLIACVLHPEDLTEFTVTVCTDDGMVLKESFLSLEEAALKMAHVAVVNNYMQCDRQISTVYHPVQRLSLSLGWF